jgi:hypothetical protein
MHDPEWFTVRLQSEASDDPIRRAFSAGAGRWVGCDWDTDFGPRHLNLRGIRARQAALLAHALAGAEAQAWFEAEDWLQQVERDASDAEVAADQAFMFAASNDHSKAESAALRACEIAAKYSRGEVWQPLLDAIRTAKQ